MLNISKIQTTDSDKLNHNIKVTPAKNNSFAEKMNNFYTKKPSSENYKAYYLSFGKAGKKEENITNSQLKALNGYLDKESKLMLDSLNKKGILNDNSSNDGSTVMDNLIKIAKEPRIQGLDKGIIIKEVIKALDNPFSITQKFGDIPIEVANQIKSETGMDVPTSPIFSSSCVAASMEFNLASRKPAEFARFAEGLSSKNYSVNKNIKLSDISDGFASSIWMLREFNSDYKIAPNWNDVSVNIKPDRNAIVRARVQTSYKDEKERSCVDVLIQSAILNLCSQSTYNALTDERTGKFNPDNAGLTDFEKTFGEQILFERPIISVVYQNLDENGYLTGYNCEREETKQHILKSLESGHNVIIGYTHLDENNKVDGGHEITVIGYEQDKNGNGYFVCNDTDDDLNESVKISEDKLLPLIHHAGISKDSLNENDVVVETWREIVNDFQEMIKKERNI